MVDLFGAITGILGSCDVILRATTAIAGYVSDVKNAPKDFARIADEIENLQAITAALQEFLKSERVRKLQLDNTAPIANAVEKCKARISALKQDFRTKKRKNRLLWPLVGKADIEKTLADLDRFTNLFHWALSANGRSFFCKTSEETTRNLEHSLKSLQNVVGLLRPVPDMQQDVREIKDHLDVIQSMLEVLANDTEKQVEEAASAELSKPLETVNSCLQLQADTPARKELLEWLSPDDLLQNHRDISLVRQKDTGIWIFNEEG
jgi:hypothetical protein